MRFFASCAYGLAIGAAVALSACGGGGGGANAAPQVYASKPENDAQALRFLSQASMGAAPADVSRVKALGYEGWIDEQLNQTQLQSTYVDAAKASQTAFKNTKIRTLEVYHSWWGHAIADPAQLRQRIAFALSQIFVVSVLDGTLSDNGLLVVSYQDMLERSIDGNYRQLLENVTLHPAMGIYLSHRGNRKENSTTGRVPDQNFAREVMQLFSLGLYMLNEDGSLQLNNSGKPIETYGSADVMGLSRVMTGFSWWRPTQLTNVQWFDCFYRNSKCTDERQLTTAMSAYEQEHSVSEKVFLGKTIPAVVPPAVADPVGDLKIALDHLAAHPNVAPFISKQLIQRLVTSNPSPAYVADVVNVFQSSQGNIKAVVKAILLHPQARVLPQFGLQTYGKVREPLLRMTHLLRALPHTSDWDAAARSAGTVPFYAINDTDNPGTSLGQSPLRAPSVFNFFRPGYTPVQTALGQQGLVAPELQLASETSVVGFANFMTDMLNNGWGDGTLGRRDVRFNLSSFEALADDPAALVDAVTMRVLGSKAPEPLRTTAVDAISKMANKTAADKTARAKAAVLLVAVSPDFTVQQ